MGLPMYLPLPSSFTDNVKVTLKLQHSSIIPSGYNQYYCIISYGSNYCSKRQPLHYPDIKRYLMGSTSYGSNYSSKRYLMVSKSYVKQFLRVSCFSYSNSYSFSTHKPTQVKTTFPFPFSKTSNLFNTNTNININTKNTKYITIYII